MKVIAVILVIGFCILAGAPMSSASNQSEKRGTCCSSSENQGGRMSSHMSTPTQACTCKSPTPFHGAQTHKSCNGACTLLAMTPALNIGILGRIKRYAVNGYRRITGKNILENQTRLAVYEHIVSSPGIDLKTLSQMTDINENTLRYHIGKMYTGKKIQITTIGGISHFFENHGRYSEEEQIHRARLFSPGSSRILQIVGQCPGISRGELANKLGIAGPTVTRGIGHLIDDGLISFTRDGKFVRYYPGWTDATHAIKNTPI
jgi:DNA-binding transcriptional ArsR family regulator